jgi:hypothetical protein
MMLTSSPFGHLGLQLMMMIRLFGQPDDYDNKPVWPTWADDVDDDKPFVQLDDAHTKPVWPTWADDDSAANDADVDTCLTKSMMLVRSAFDHLGLQKMMIISPFGQLDDADDKPVWPNWAVDVDDVDDDGDKSVWPIR